MWENADQQCFLNLKNPFKLLIILQNSIQPYPVNLYQQSGESNFFSNSIKGKDEHFSWHLCSFLLQPASTCILAEKLRHMV